MSTVIYKIPSIPYDKISTSFTYSFIRDYSETTKHQLPQQNQLEIPKHGKILTYFRDELRFLCQREIAYIYIENSTTYIIDMDGKRSTTNKSLELLCRDLCGKSFFRANRQVIISASAITKIIKIGNCKLKVETKPESEKIITISKNKVSSFKRWLKN